MVERSIVFDNIKTQKDDHVSKLDLIVFDPFHDYIVFKNLFLCVWYGPIGFLICIMKFKVGFMFVYVYIIDSVLGL